jgi:RNA polymerase sigma-70 factor (ECF subfamily)
MRRQPYANKVPSGVSRAPSARQPQHPPSQPPIQPPLKPEEPEQTAAAEGAADLVLVRAALAGDNQARARLADRLAGLPALVRARHLRMGAPLDPAALEDVTQNVLLALWRKLSRFDGRTGLPGWALGFASFELLKEIARRRRQRELASLMADPIDPASAAPTGPDEDLLRLLQRLPSADVDLLRYRHLEGLDFREIAARLGSPVATAKTRYYRALQALRRRLPAPPGEGR